MNGEGYEQVGEWLMGPEMGNLGMGKLTRRNTQEYRLFIYVVELVRARENIRSCGGKQKITISDK